MPSYAERLAIREKVERSAKMAATYLRKAADALYWDETRPISTWYWRLLDQALEAAADIVEHLPDDFFEDSVAEDWLGLGVGGQRHNLSDEPLERAEKVVAALRARRERTVLRRTVLQLEDTTGRTPEEAEAYRAKAAELRDRHGLAG